MTNYSTFSLDFKIQPPLSKLGLNHKKSQLKLAF
jgi:hypothetical protein